MSNRRIYCDFMWPQAMQAISDSHRTQQALDRLLPPVWVTPVGRLILAILRADREASSST